MDIGEKIKTLRIARGMTLEELGNAVGVGKSTVRKWENGIIANMRRDKVAKIADALHVSPAYLMGWPDPEPDPDELKELYSLAEKASPEKKQLAIEAFKAIIKSSEDYHE